MKRSLARLALGLAACAPASSDDTGATSTSTSTATATSTSTSTGDVECSEFADIPVTDPPVTITIHNLRPTPIALRAPSCSARAAAIDGPDGSGDPLLPFEYACPDPLQQAICHPYAAPDGCESLVAAFVAPGATLVEVWDGATYRPRDLPAACRGEPTPFADPAECDACRQRAPALAGPHEAVVTAWTDVTCDGDTCSIVDPAATVEVRLPFTLPIAGLDLAID